MPRQDPLIALNGSAGTGKNDNKKPNSINREAVKSLFEYLTTKIHTSENSINKVKTQRYLKKKARP